MFKDKNMKQLDEEQKRIQETISKIKHRIAVFSGKGGVGKTTLSVNLAFCFRLEGFSTGILDADITGPNVAKMLDIHSDLIYLNEKIIPFEKSGVKMVSMASILTKGQPLIWRGPMRSKMINHFIANVEWDILDYLITDLPPGTGDEILTIAQEMRPDFAVIVTTPQEVSVIDAERAINMAKQMKIPYIGVVENMSGLICPHCNNVIDLFGIGGGKILAKENKVKFLGSIPMDINTRILCDKGQPVVLKEPSAEISESFKSIMKNIELIYKEKELFNIV